MEDEGCVGVEDRGCVEVEDRVRIGVVDKVCIGVEDRVCVRAKETSGFGIEGWSRVDNAIELGLDEYKVDGDDNEDDDGSVDMDVNTMSDGSVGVGREETMDDNEDDDGDDGNATDGPKTRDLEKVEDGVTTEDTEYSLDK